MKLSALRGGIRDLDVYVPGEDEPVHVRYRPGELTLEVSDAMRDAMDKGILEKTVSIFLEKVLVSWDLEDDVLDENGDPTGETVTLPVTYEGMKKVPIPFLGLLMEQIGEDARPNPQTGENSRSGLPQEVSPDAAQNGTTSFGLQSSTESPLGSSLSDQ